MYRYLLLPIILFICITVQAQDNEIIVAPYLSKYPNNDLVIRDMVQSIEFRFNKTTKTFEVEEEIKYYFIALKPGKTIQIPVFFDNNTEILDAKISKGPLSKTTGNYHPEGIFHSDVKLTLLQAYVPKIGEIRTITIKKRLYDIYQYSSIYFNIENYPVDNSSIKLIVPKSFQIDFIPDNTENYDFQKTETQSEEEINYFFTCNNIPSFKDEKNKPPTSYYIPKLFVVPKKYKYKDEQINFFSDLQNYYNWCKNKINLTKNNPEKIKPTVDQIIADKKTDIEKIKSIYYWVQEQIRYIAFEEGLRGYIPDNAQSVLYNKYGDCKGMANLLKTMLTIAGFDARLAWLGTQEIKINFSIPNLAASNHMICALFFNNTIYYLDATGKHSCLGLNSENISGRQVLIENENSYILDTIPRSVITPNSAEAQTHLKIQNQELIGTIALKFQGDIRSILLNEIIFNDKEEKSKILEKIVTRASSKILAKDITASEFTNNDSILKINGTLSIKGQVSPIDKELYLNPDPFEDLSDLAASDGKKLAQYFELRQQRKYSSVIEMPDEYTLQKLPENFELKNEYISFSLKYSKNGNNLEFSKEWVLYENLIPNNQIAIWNGTLKKIKKALSQPIILNKP
jgi:hypothetical protein